jgi:hypothetical protein
MDWKKENMDASTKYPQSELEEKKRGAQDLLFITCYKMPINVIEPLGFATWSITQSTTILC